MGAAAQVGLLKLNTKTPWLVVTVSVKLIVVPQTKDGEVLN